MEGIKQELENFSSLIGISTLLEPAFKSAERCINGTSESQDLLFNIEQWGSHTNNTGIDVDQLGTETDEIRVIAVN